ncbi:alpha/beta fold hydrolase [Nocardioides daejeonensis]|uniref:alpha/beta fold hydrolase n=1 Tax=Nocardioides daejeonensis TaxID=1046556 RepID=UPI000D74992A|nr:alpha/beta fold hydrolase [Nocardioides daejeonensis]
MSFARRPLPYLLAGGLCLVLVAGLVIWLATKGDPQRTPPETFPGASEPGDLVSVGPPVGKQNVKGFETRRIVYLTQDREGKVREASALVMAATDGAVKTQPILAFAHGTTGIAESCAPSEDLDRLQFAANTLVAMAQQGTVVVAPDYAGLGTPGPHGFLVGKAAAQDMLNAIRATRQMPDLQVSKKALVWGQSQGAHAALWTGMLAPDYAPDIKLLGVAATAPPTDLLKTFDYTQDTSAQRRLWAYLLDSWRQVYPDSGLWDEVDPSNRELIEKIGDRCGNQGLNGMEKQLKAPVLPALEPGTTFYKLVEENLPDGKIEAPVRVSQGGSDEVVPVASQRAWVQRRCAAGQAIDYREYPNATHVGIAYAEVTDVIKWLIDRLEGKPAASSCPQ